MLLPGKGPSPLVSRDNKAPCQRHGVFYCRNFFPSTNKIHPSRVLQLFQQTIKEHRYEIPIYHPHHLPHHLPFRSQR